VSFPLAVKEKRNNVNERGKMGRRSNWLRAIFQRWNRPTKELSGRSARFERATANKKTGRPEVAGDRQGIILDAQRDHVQGQVEAPIALLEYGDYECPSCARAQPIVREIQQRLGDKLCFAFRHFPVTPVHPQAELAAQAAEAANAQGKFWEMHELLLENQRALDNQYLPAFAAALGLDEARLIGEVMLKTYARRICHDFNLGVRDGVNGTPCFFINGRRYDGAIRLEPLLVAIAQRDRGRGFAVDSPTTPPRPRSSEEVVMRLFAAFNAGDLETLNKLTDPQGIWHTSHGNLRFGGPSATLKERCPMCASLRERKIHIDIIIPEGDYVAVRSTWSGIYSGTYDGVSVSDKPITITYYDIYRVSDGVIRENWASFDRQSLSEQLGLSSQPSAQAK
jgi:protein-disulfide isomerase/predicted ester cyclase